MLKYSVLRWLNALAYVLMIVVNVLSNTRILNGMTTGEVSDMYKALITPAGYAFIIWGVIYLLLLGFLIYSFTGKPEARKSVELIQLLFVLSCVLNAGWVVLWQYLYIELAFLVIAALLITLGAIYKRTRSILNPTIGQIWCVRLPFSVYFGWVSAATVLNFAVVLTKNNGYSFGLGEISISIALLLLGAIAAILISYPYRDSIYPLVFVWAYVAIAVEQWQLTSNVALAAIILAAILLVYSIYLFIARNRERD